MAVHETEGGERTRVTTLVSGSVERVLRSGNTLGVGNSSVGLSTGEKTRVTKNAVERQGQSFGSM